MQYVRIPEERVKVIIGTEGKTKKTLESKTECKLKIEGNEVSVEGDAIHEWVAKDVVHAVGRGFNPEKALLLLNDDYTLVLIELDDYTTTDKSLDTKRGRVIGEKGRTRKFIETKSGALLSVYGKTVGILGSFESVEVAKKAVLMLLSGAGHSSVYKFLERKRKR
ncbi:MAG: KH domain-containing protein [Candidatus Altiarchaeota archaeon]|nr:KH domain-containing protein [Candidatus Altiarchaeota archaeon]